MESIENGKPLECTGTYSKSIISVIESVYRSHELGREVEVKLD